MKIVCGMTAHNEDWVIGLTVRAARMWADEVVVLNHNSNDGTQEILEAAAQEVGNITILPEPSKEFVPLQFYRRLLVIAKQMQATHLAILDADEVLSGNLVPYIRQHIEHLSPFSTLEFPWVPVANVAPLAIYWTTLRTGFAFPLCANLSYPEPPEYNLHYSRLPSNIGRYVLFNEGALLHLAYVDKRRLQAKELRWKMMELTRWPNRRSVAWLNDYYDAAVYGIGQSIPCPSSWWTYQHLEKFLSIGGESSIEKEIKQGWDPVRFAGLNTFGIV